MKDICRVTSELNRHEELERDQVRDVEAYRKEATEDLCWKVMQNEEHRPFDLQDFLAEQKDLPELVAQAWQVTGFRDFVDIIESRLRARLDGSEAVEDRAAEMAREAE